MMLDPDLFHMACIVYPAQGLVFPLKDRVTTHPLHYFAHSAGTDLAASLRCIAPRRYARITLSAEVELTKQNARPVAGIERVDIVHPDDLAPALAILLGEGVHRRMQLFDPNHIVLERDPCAVATRITVGGTRNGSRIKLALPPKLWPSDLLDVLCRGVDRITFGRNVVVPNVWRGRPPVGTRHLRIFAGHHDRGNWLRTVERHRAA